MFRIIMSWAGRLVAASSLLFSLNIFAQTNVALNKPTSASSAIQPTSAAVDGNGNTRWESTQGINTAWLQIDLGGLYSLISSAIDWEAANAANYELQGSTDNASWTTLVSRSGGTFGNRTDTLSFSGNYRYLRINCLSRSAGNNWGYSIWEWRVFGSPVASSTSSKTSSTSSTSSSSSSSAVTNLALNGVTAASTAIGASALAVDGNMSTRWESAHGVDPSWISVDLGSEKSLSSVVIYWEAANAATYEVQGSNNNSTWSTLASRSSGAFGNRTDTVSVSGSYRYIRIYGTSRSAGNYWGYSIYELQVFGSGGAISSSSVSSTASSSSSDRNLYNAPRATTAPVIDGVMDPIWNSAPWAPIDDFWLGSQRPTAQDFSGRYKVMWDQNNLYLLFDITDDVLYDATANPLERYWDDDSVEIFIDDNKNGGNHQYNTSAWAYHVSTLGDVVDFTNSTAVKLLNSHITVKRVSNGSKHLWEMSMRVYGENYTDAGPNTPVPLFLNKLMGFSVCYNDNDASANRESMVGSVDTQGHKNDMGYIDASVFGSLRLVETAP